VRPDGKVSFLAFFLIWATRMHWKVPDFHVRVCHWLEYRGLLAVLQMPRGHAKSTILGVYNAWCYYCDQTYRILHQGDQDKTARKTSLDTKNVLQHHPLTANLSIKGEVDFWTVEGNSDARNPSMQAAGILSNITSSRADEIQNDDVEVPKNVGTPEAREKMRYRIGEQIHILVPGGKTLFVGTPHTYDSIYDQQIALGADKLVIRMFGKELRFDDAKRGKFPCAFKPDMVIAGIGRPARLLEEGIEWSWANGTITFATDPAGLVDCYADPVWHERFTLAEMLQRRRKCETLNAWDGQYQLHAKPVRDVRLDPERIVPYDVQPEVRNANGALGMYMGSVQIVGASLRWDPSSGKLNADASALALVLQDQQGRRYWHRADRLHGDIAEFNDKDTNKITGGQVWQIADMVEQLQLPRVTIETNGIGGFAPAILKACLKQRRLQCGVTEAASTGNKNKRILAAFEPLLKTRGQLWAHLDVLKSEAWDQMRDWNPSVSDQPDDYLDAAGAAILDQPERIGRIVGNPTARARQDWAAMSGSFDVEFSR
jgi:hypothetical protein